MTRQRNKTQWIVDEAGLIGDDDYWIEKSRLLDMRGDFYEWPLQVCTKSWVDFPAFCQAFERALQVHRKRYSKSRLAATIAKCEQQIARSKDYDATARELFPQKFNGPFQLWKLTEMQTVEDELSRRYAAARAANDNVAARSAA